MATNSTPLLQLPSSKNEPINDAENSQSIENNNNHLTSADLLNGNKKEINKDNDTIGNISKKKKKKTLL
ncbi:hypothetical protein PIROE2DRAFT_6478 [Piromyces sp. E2]|nr:hypothetical protein PIROE2DRAFT_6478 [Piromyces sp. E2]|eukprot:OUM66337.1 hypothetical protein PIROE2DRAFT_6478 [Piromyces sp. E2]